MTTSHKVIRTAPDPNSPTLPNFMPSLIPNILSNLDGDGGSRLKKASSDKGLEEAEVSERSKGGGESEAAPGGRNNRMSYPVATAKGPLRKKRSSSSRLAGIGKY